VRETAVEHVSNHSESFCSLVHKNA